MIEAFADWANSIAALAVAKPQERIDMVRVNEAMTARALSAWELEGKRYEMKKPRQVWLKA